MLLPFHDNLFISTGEVAEYVNKDLNSSTAGSETSVVNNPPVGSLTLLLYNKADYII